MPILDTLLVEPEDILLLLLVNSLCHMAVYSTLLTRC